MTSKDQVFPDFGSFGGAFVAPALEPYLDELSEAFTICSNDEKFLSELLKMQTDFIGRPTPLLHAVNASRILGGAQIYLKLEGLANTGAHKINNAYGQGLLAKYMGKRKIVTETGAGQHGIATACVCARLGIECTVFMGLKDCIRQKPNVYLMELFGAKVQPVTRGTQTLTDAVDAAFEHLEKHHNDTYYLIGSALGPNPYPHIVREFQAVIGNEVKSQFEHRCHKSPSVMIACVGGGSNAIGFFNAFLDNPDVRMVGVEAGGTGTADGEHAVRMSGRAVESIHQGYRSLFLRNNDGSLMPTSSISAGLDYAGIGPQLASLGKNDRIEFTSARDSEVIEAFSFFAQHEGIIAAMESSHALASAMKIAPTLPSDQSIIVNVSGRGDKDIFITAPRISGKKWVQFLSDEVERLKSAGF
ncbi:MAG TPA: tryptophan synthase subunit beta [Chitinispirillaceae bacterium]|nr:tryptophan synthase subunit beta [Chitinispirillaceae bacterium]